MEIFCLPSPSPIFWQIENFFYSPSWKEKTPKKGGVFFSQWIYCWFLPKLFFFININKKYKINCWFTKGRINHEEIKRINYSKPRHPNRFQSISFQKNLQLKLPNLICLFFGQFLFTNSIFYFTKCSWETDKNGSTLILQFLKKNKNKILKK